MNKRLLILGLVLGLVLIFLSTKPLIAPTPQNKIYANSKYQFQLLYPRTWRVEEWDLETAAGLTHLTDGTILYQGKFFGKDGHFEILIWQNKSKTPVRNWLTWYRHEDLILTDLPPKENFSLSGIQAIRYLQKQTSRKKPILFIFFNRDDKFYELTQEREDLTSMEATDSAGFIHPVYDQILESFKFLAK